jgi:superfamily II DNA or RNA helicase
MIDEAHGAKANELKAILEKCTNVEERFGFTGTLDGMETNQMTIEGLLGPVKVYQTAKQLMDSGRAATLKIKSIVLRYPDDECRFVSKMKYPAEIDYIISHERRNRFIKNLALSLKNNTLILFHYVDKHGIPFFKYMQDKTDRPLYYVSGKTDVDTREELRVLMEKENNVIAVCSDGTFSTGINIKNLHNILLISPSKARIKLLQSIGRSIRLHDSKDFATLYDIADDFQWKSKKNYTLEHFEERIKVYNSEDFDYKIYNVELK